MTNDFQVEQNPYQPPVASTGKPAAGSPSASGLPAGNELDFIRIAKKWEWYRLIYNGVLISLTLLFGLVLFAANPPLEMLEVSVIGALVCNFFFLLGPAIDGYAQWISGSRSNFWGIVVFVLGLLFSILLVLTAIAAMGFTASIPDQL